MPFSKGDFLIIDYTAKVKDEDRIIETTSEKEAKEAGIYDEGEIYGPKLLILGEGWLLSSLESEILKMNEGEERVVELPPERAFGLRDPSKIRVIPARELTQRRIRPVLGATVEINGKVGIIRSVGSGRVVIDFNHPLAGKTLIYRVKIIKKLETIDEKLRALLHRRMPKIDESKFIISMKGDIVTIKLPEEAFLADGIQVVKRAIVSDIRRYLPQVKILRFIEEFRVAPKEERPKGSKPETTKESQPQQ